MSVLMQHTFSFEELKMPLKSRFGWLNCSSGAVKGQGVKGGWSPGRRANKHPLSSARSGGCGDQMIIKQYMKWNITVGIKPFHMYVAKFKKQTELLTA